MAQKKARKPAAKTAGKKSGKFNITKDASFQKRNRQTEAILIFAGAVLLASVVLIPGSNVWNFFHRLFFGVFGFFAYLWPPLLLYISIAAAMDRPSSSIRVKLPEALGLISLLDAAYHVFTVGGWVGFKELYSRGVAFTGGGVAGGLLGAPLDLAFGKTGAAITIFLLIFVFAMLVTGFTLVQLLSVFIPSLRKKQQTKEYAKMEPRAMKFSHRKPRFDINVDIDQGDGNGESSPMPDHPVQSAGPEEGRRKKQEPFKGLDELVSKITGNDKKTPKPQNAGEEMSREPLPAEHSVPDTETAQKDSYVYPPVTLLKKGAPNAAGDISGELKANAERLVDTLKSFGVETRIIDISRGPAVTRYELQPSAGVKISRITALADDIALNLAAAGVRIEAPIPNKAAVGIEVPNRVVSMVHIRDIIDSDEFKNAKSRLTFSLGRDIAGHIAVADIGSMPHMLIAGATGSGKSVCINSIIISLLYKSTPEEVRLLLVDPKVVELGVYNGIPHLLVPVVTDPHKAAGALNWAVTEMLKRYNLFAQSNVRDIKGYNELARHTEEMSPLPQIVIIIDELADLMMAAPNEVEDAICRLAQMARAAGMHLVIATQRPSVDVITGIIKANIPSRIAFSVYSQVDSRTILDMSGAEKLLGRGDMLFFPVGTQKPIRIQGCFVSDKEVESVIEFIKSSSGSEYSEDIMDEIEKEAVKSASGKNAKKGDDSNDGDTDPMLDQAIECVIDAGAASTSLLQRRLKLGYARAARIVDQMEQKGIVSPLDGSKPRQVLITRQQFLEMQAGKRPD